MVHLAWPHGPRRGPVTRLRRAGSVLPAVILVLLGMTLLSHAAFVLALRQLRVSEVSRELLRASLAAEAGLDALMREVGLHSSLTESSASVARSWGTDATFRLTSVRLTDELSWVTAEGKSNHIPVPVRLGRLVWTLHPIGRVSGTPAVARAPLFGVGGVSADDWWSVPTAADTLACDTALEEMHVRGAQRPEPMGTTTDSVALGLFSFTELESVADLSLSGAVTPGPASQGGTCQGGLVTNWGDPASSTSPCAAWYPLIWSSSDLHMEGGMGQGILAVAGDVRFSAGAMFRGVVLATGDVRVGGGSTIEGMVMGGRVLDVQTGSRIRGSACAAWAALDSATRLRFPIALESRRRLYLP